MVHKYLYKIVSNLASITGDYPNCTITLNDGTSREVTIEEQKAIKRLELTDAINEYVSIKIANIYGFDKKCDDLIIKELNLNSQIVNLMHEQLSRSLTIEELNFINTIKTYFIKVQQLRTYASALKISLASADLTTFDYTIGWPE